jgi:hypothetical protein
MRTSVRLRLGVALAAGITAALLWLPLPVASQGLAMLFGSFNALPKALSVTTNGYVNAILISATAGTGTATGKIGGVVIYNDFATTGSTGGGAEADVSSFTVPANTLSSNGQRLHVMACALHAANGNSTTFRPYINAVAQGTTTHAIASIPVCMDVELTRTTSSTFTVHGFAHNSSTFTQVATRQTSINFAASFIIKYAVQAATTTNDLIGNLMTVTWYPEK